MKKIAIINSRAPFAENQGKDALDLALILGSYEQAVSLFFHQDGVFQLIENTQLALLKQKDYLKTFAAFELYDIEKVYVCQASLTERGLSNNFHIDNVDVLSQVEFNQALAQHDVIYRF
ncbi:sulfurtransferase complex subunit TusC [Thalassotalea agariperforans]